MKLYVLEIRAYLTDKETWRNKLKYKFPLTLNGDDHSSDEGEWSIPMWAFGLLGQPTGYWSSKSDSDRISSIWLMEDDDPNMISWLWRDMPQGLAHIDGILKLPLSLGETGDGVIDGLNLTDYTINWKVIERGF